MPRLGMANTIAFVAVAGVGAASIWALIQVSRLKAALKQQNINTAPSQPPQLSGSHGMLKRMQ